jgi:hypothetical protein
MAKYRITSIPQFSNGGINKPTQPTEYTVDPMYQTEPTQDENIDRLFSKIYAPQLESQDGLYETLQPEDCPPGFQPYKGECVDSKTFRELQWKEEDYNYEKELAQAKQIDELTSEEQSGERQQIFEDKFSRYVGNALKKGNKHKKLEPFQTYTQEQFDKYLKPRLNELSSVYYFEPGSDGKVNAYPKGVITNLIYNQGVRPYEFKKYHGLDDKQIQSEFSDIIAYADQDYNANVTKELQKKISSGMSAEDARKELEKEGWGTKKGIDTEFKDISDSLDVMQNADIYFTDDQGVMYKQDTKGNVFQYTSRNQWNNDNFSVFNDKSNFKNDYKNKFTWNFDWKPIDKSLFKTDENGNTAINNNDVSIFANRFPNRKNGDSEEKILKTYEKDINTINKELNTPANPQDNYTSLNNRLFDNVYGSTWSGSLSPINPLTDAVTPAYSEAYNDAVNKMNALTEIDMGIDVNPANIKAYKDVSSNPDKFQKEKAKILEEFNNKVKNLKFKMGDTDISYGKLSGDRNITAYKSPDTFKSQKNKTIDQEAQSYLNYAFLNNILPTETNVQNTDEYRGEGKSLSDQYGNFQNFLGSPEAQNFLKTYREQPSYGQTLLGETFKNKAINLYKDKSKKELEDAKFLQNRFQNNLKTVWDNPYTKLLKYTTGYDVTKMPFVMDQAMSFVNQPVNTLEKWMSGKWQDPMVSTMTDQATPMEADAWAQAYGPGGRQLFYDKAGELQNPFSEVTNLFSPFHWGAQTGSTAYQNYVNDNPDIDSGDVALNAFFAAAPYSKTLEALSGARLLPKLSKAAPIVSKFPTYEVARNLATPGNALLTKFGMDAFNLDPDNPGFAIEAGKNIYQGLQEGDQKKINENLLPLGMGLMIGRHGYKNLRDARYLDPFIKDPALFDREYNNFVVPEQKYGGPGPGRGRRARAKEKISKEREREREVITTPELPFVYESSPVQVVGSQPSVTPGSVFPSAQRINVLPEQPKANQLSFDFSEKNAEVVPNLDAYVYETAVPPTGLNLNVTANPNSPLYKAINPKTGKINFDQALNILRKTAGGDEVVESLFNNPELWQGMGSDITHMDAKELLKNVQDAIPALQRTEVPFDFVEGTFDIEPVFDPELGDYREVPASTYGLQDIYPDPFRKLYRNYKLGANRSNPSVVSAIDKYSTDIGKKNLRIERKNAKIEKVKSALEKGESTIINDSGDKQIISPEYLKALEQSLENDTAVLNKKQESYLANKDTFADFQISNPRTIQFSNVNEFGYGSRDHGNTHDTLAHAHIYENAYEPDALYVSQIQSDAAEQFSKMKKRYRKNDSGEFDLEAFLPEFEQRSTGTYFSPDINFKVDREPIAGEAADVIKRNLPQKRVLMTNKKSTEKRLIQEMLQYAAEQGKKHIYIPTPELSTKIQGNDKASSIYDDYKKHYIKLFGKSNVMSHTDQFGNDWLKLNIPESYSKGEGIIEAYKDGGSKLPKASYGIHKLKEFIKEPEPIEKDFEFLHNQTYGVPSGFNIPGNISYREFAKPAPKLPIQLPSANVTLPQSIKNLLIDDRLITGKEDQFPLLGHMYPNEVMNLDDYVYQPYSEGWTAVSDMKNALEGEQWNPSKEDFFTDDEVVDLVNKEIDYRNTLNTFDEMYPESPGMEIMRALSGDTSRDELFSNLFPDAYLPNFRSKILSPEQSAKLNEIGLSNITFTNRGMLNKSSLRSLTKGEDVLPSTYKDLLKSKENDWLQKAPAKDVVMEMRVPGVKTEDILKATPKQLETWRQEIVKRMYNQALERWKNESAGPLKGLDAYNQIINRTGSRNKNGGFVSAKLTKKEIDQYIKGGYIIEDE